MRYNIKILTGLVTLTERWADFKNDFFDFACAYGDERWQTDPQFRNYMKVEFIKSKQPITTRLYNLDQRNLQILIRYIDEELMAGTADMTIDI